VRATAQTRLNLAFANLLRMLQQDDYAGVEQSPGWMLRSEMLTVKQAVGLRDAIAAVLDPVSTENSRRI